MFEIFPEPVWRPFLHEASLAAPAPYTPMYILVGGIDIDIRTSGGAKGNTFSFVARNRVGDGEERERGGDRGWERLQLLLNFLRSQSRIKHTSKCVVVYVLISVSWLL